MSDYASTYNIFLKLIVIILKLNIRWVHPGVGRGGREGLNTLSSLQYVHSELFELTSSSAWLLAAVTVLAQLWDPEAECCYCSPPFSPAAKFSGRQWGTWDQKWLSGAPTRICSNKLVSSESSLCMCHTAKGGTEGAFKHTPLDPPGCSILGSYLPSTFLYI